MNSKIFKNHTKNVEPNKKNSKISSKLQDKGLVGSWRGAGGKQLATTSSLVWCGLVWFGWFGKPKLTQVKPKPPHQTTVWFGCGLGVVWCGLVWFGVVWCGLGVVWCGLVWFGCGLGLALKPKP